MKLSKFLDGKTSVDLKIVKVDHITTEDGETKIALLWLDKPIDEVPGSQFVKDEATGDNVRISAFDVEVIRVSEKNFDADGIDINEDGTGTVKSDLRLDVAKGSQEVWLTDETFAAYGRNKRTELRKGRDGGILTKMNERRAKAAFKGNTTSSPAAGASKVAPESVGSAPKVGAKTA